MAEPGMDAGARVVAVLLAGGLSRRMGGGDKCLQQLRGKPLLEHVIERIRPQVTRMVLNAAGDPARFTAFGLPVVPDVVSGFAGPLAGILTGLEWAAREAPECRWIVSIPTDAPFLPRDLVTRLVAGAQQADGGDALACAASAGRTHPVVGLWPLSCRAALKQALVTADVRKIDRFTADFICPAVAFSDVPVDPFLNANRPEDLARAEELADAVI